jgi:hypothetical protein
MPASGLYHQQLACLLKTNDGLRLSLKFDHAYELNNRDRLIRLTDRVPLDGVLLNIRAAFTRKAGFISSYKSEGARYYVLHPFLFRRREFGVWNRLENQGFKDSIVITSRRSPTHRDFNAPPPGVRISRFRLGESNHLIGMLLGLDRWAIQDELFDLAGFNQVCLEKRLPFFVLCPVLSDSSFVLSRLCRKLTAAIRARLSVLRVPCCSLEHLVGDTQIPLHLSDGIHLTADGHRLLAEQLYSGMTPWIKAILDKTQNNARSIEENKNSFAAVRWSGV